MAGGEHVLFALGALATVVRQVGALLILFETTAPRQTFFAATNSVAPSVYDEPGIPAPQAAAFADIVIEGFGKLEVFTAGQPKFTVRSTS